MLQRAASNAYSWWWASHIRTKQSKWLEQNLSEMEEKVQNTLKLIEEEGDSFAKRAEMYYKNRPELILFVQEAFRSYRALAERYDHLSTELQKANTTIASVFPEQVQFAMEEEEEYNKLKQAKKLPQVSPQNVPKAPSGPVKELKNMFSNAVKFQNKQNSRTSSASTAAKAPQKSGLSKEDALAKIDKLQKEILVLQTEKEFLKSSYEHGAKKYKSIDKEIDRMQEQVFNLKDEFGDGMFIEDEEARNLMSSAALKSCTEALQAKIQEKHKTAKEAKVEHKRVKALSKKLEAMISMARLQGKQPVEPRKKLKSKEQERERKAEHKEELAALRGDIKEHFEAGEGSRLTVTETAEKIDELVNKVISLETEVSSQTALIQRLRTETDELQAQIQTLEDDKAISSDDFASKLQKLEKKLEEIQDLDQSVGDQNNKLETHLTEARCNLAHLSGKLGIVKPDEELEIALGPPVEEKKLKKSRGERKSHKSIKNEAGSDKEVEMDEEPVKSQEKTRGGEEAAAALSISGGTKEAENLKQDKELEIRGSSQTVEEPNKSQEPDQREAASLDSSSVNKEEVNVTNSLNKQELPDSQEKPQTSVEDSEKAKDDGKDSEVSTSVINQQGGGGPKKTLDRYLADKGMDALVDKAYDSLQEQVDEEEEETEQDGEPNWKRLFQQGMQDKEKTLLAEYTTVLRNYKEVKKSLAEVEKKSQEGFFETTLHIRELRAENAVKDEEIRSLRQKLKHLQTMFDAIKDGGELKTDIQSPKSLGDVLGKDDMKFVLEDPSEFSPVEEKFRGEIDALLEENLDFWLRFSTSFHQIQKFETGFKDLEVDAKKIEKAKKNDVNNARKCSLKTEARSIYRHLREIQTELTVWLEQSALLKDELQTRLSSLCSIQEAIAKASKDSSEDGAVKLTTYQAAQFQGELLNMKQENHKVADELQAGLDHVNGVHLQVERCLTRLNDEFGLSGGNDNAQLNHSESRNRVPLSSFIFGVKPKKQKQSIFSVVSPALNKKYNNIIR